MEDNIYFYGLDGDFSTGATALNLLKVILLRNNIDVTDPRLEQYLTKQDMNQNDAKALLEILKPNYLTLFNADDALLIELLLTEKYSDLSILDELDSRYQMIIDSFNIIHNITKGNWLIFLGGDHVLSHKNKVASFGSLMQEQTSLNIFTIYTETINSASTFNTKEELINTIKHNTLIKIEGDKIFSLSDQNKYPYRSLKKKYARLTANPNHIIIFNDSKTVDLIYLGD